MRPAEPKPWPGVTGARDATLDDDELSATVASIAAVQLDDGMVPWFVGGHADPWNHVEAAMALDVGGRRSGSEAAYRWLATTQRPDGAWHQYYLSGSRVKESTLDANVSAYVATGAWHHYLSTGDTSFLGEMWPVVERAVGFVLGLQAPGGEILWARHADGTAWAFALLTASSSTYFSLRCAVAIAHRLGHQRPEWGVAVAALGRAIAQRPHAFMPKDRWAMDWYYPVLAGAVQGRAGADRLAEGRRRFLLDDHGTRCVADRPWVTAAETAECAMAHVTAGEHAWGHRLLAATRDLRHDDGSYFTGMVHPERVHFPGGERTTYSAAAVVLATDALVGTGPASGLFRAAPLTSGTARMGG